MSGVEVQRARSGVAVHARLGPRARSMRAPVAGLEEALKAKSSNVDAKRKTAQI